MTRFRFTLPVMIGELLSRKQWGMPMTTERIEIDPAIMTGKPAIKGTRITVELILQKLAEGATEAELRVRVRRRP